MAQSCYLYGSSSSIFSSSSKSKYNIFQSNINSNTSSPPNQLTGFFPISFSNSSKSFIPFSFSSSFGSGSLSTKRRRRRRKEILPPVNMAGSPGKNQFASSDHLRHVESLSTLPSGAGEIPRLNAVILGGALASEEDDLVFPSQEFSSQALVSSPAQYLEMYKKSILDPSGFWSEIASEFYWEKKWPQQQQVYTENLDVRKGDIKIEWFKGGMTNICYNALDRNIDAGNGDKIAMYWEGNELNDDGSLTYTQLLHKVCQLANYLKDIGVSKGDAVVIYLPMLMELPIAMLACARIGAIHSVVFAGFSADSLSQRIVDCKPKAVITCNAVRRGSKVIQLKDIVDAALVDSAKNGFSVGVVLNYENESAMKRECTKWTEGRDVWWQDTVPKYPTTCDVVWVDAEDPLFLLYTSGSTGKPKGVLHTTGGYMIYTATTFKYAFDYKSSDIYWCTADCGWITGHSYVTYGPLLNGATVVVFEGAPNYPNASRCWDIVDKYKVSLFYTAPTLCDPSSWDGDEASFFLFTCNISFVTRYSRKSLRVLGSVGEPINPSAWRWFFNVVGDSRCPISDTWWQTETGGFMITPLPGAWPQKPGSATFPFLEFWYPVIVDEKGTEIDGECSGYLCVKNSWDKDGYHWLTGRVDDVINVSGHRIGTAEVESALVSHPQCAEAAVVGVEHE
ncbi:hypothetical protein MKW92_029234, partial [Papaver armeniacum]